MALTRYDVHEERGKFVNEQHGGMVGDSQQEEEDHGGRARHAQGRAGPEDIPEPAGQTQETEFHRFFRRVCRTNAGIRDSPSKHGTAQQLDQTHRGLEITEPQGVEAQLLCQVLEGTIKEDI